MEDSQTSLNAGDILETEGNVRKIQKKGTPNLTSSSVHKLFIIVLIEQIFEKN